MAARRLRTFALVLLAQAGGGAAIARADGLPVLGVEGSPQGVQVPGSRFHYVTRRAGARTRVLQLSRTGHVVTARRLAGQLVVPVVAYDGSPSGLSADGRTLVLIRPRVRFPQPFTNLTIVATRGLRLRSRLRLRGDFSFDAISPNGARIYLIHYTSAVDPTRYRVRALNLHTGRLLAHDIVDPHNRDEKMHGNPVSRVSSLDGRWAYTLYDGAGHPFVHALDTAGETARCLDLPARLDAGAARLRLSPGGKRVLIDVRGRTQAIVDTRSLAVSIPAAAAAGPVHPPAAQVDGGRSGGSLPVALVMAAIAALIAVAALAVRRVVTGRRARLAHPGERPEGRRSTLPKSTPARSRPRADGP
jgi:hypothetical protein